MLYSKQEWSLKLYEEKGEKKLVYLPMMEWMYTVITAGYRKKKMYLSCEATVMNVSAHYLWLLLLKNEKLFILRVQILSKNCRLEYIIYFVHCNFYVNTRIITIKVGPQ